MQCCFRRHCAHVLGLRLPDPLGWVSFLESTAVWDVSLQPRDTVADITNRAQMHSLSVFSSTAGTWEPQTAAEGCVGTESAALESSQCGLPPGSQVISKLNVPLKPQCPPAPA